VANMTALQVCGSTVSIALFNELRDERFRLRTPESSARWTSSDSWCWGPPA
jgi:hypothetical protein